MVNIRFSSFSAILSCGRGFRSLRRPVVMLGVFFGLLLGDSVEQHY
jgi:hypothetical protein